MTKTPDGVTTVFHYDFDGNLIAESDADGVVAREYLYAIGTRMAMVDMPADALYCYQSNKAVKAGPWRRRRALMTSPLKSS